jgi:hypothetical protein
LAEENLTWGQRTIRLPLAFVYRTLSGIATLVGAIALAVCFRLLNPDNPLGITGLSGYLHALANGLTFAGAGALLTLLALYGFALSIIGYVASPAVLSLDEMASGCRVQRRSAGQTQTIQTVAS